MPTGSPRGSPVPAPGSCTLLEVAITRAQRAEAFDLPMAPGKAPHADVTCTVVKLCETPVHYPEGRAGYYETCNGATTRYAA